MQENTNASILVVDDQQAILDSVDMVLKEDLKVNFASNGEEALSFLSTNEVSVVLLDITLPGGKNGVDVLKAIKAAWPHTEVVMLTGNNELDTALSCFSKGAFDYVVKPFKAKELRQVVKNAQDKHDLAKMVRAFVTQRELGYKLSFGLEFNDIQKILVESASKKSHVLFAEACHRFQRMLIMDTLKMTDWNQSEAARRLKMPRNSFDLKLTTLEIPRKRPY